MNLNFNFDAKTLLSKWWTIVRDNFQSIQSDFNTHVSEFNTAKKDLQKQISDEINARESADGALRQSIASESAARESADNALEKSVTAEADTRSRADTALGERVDNEASERKKADSALDGRLYAVEKKAHTHANQDVLDKINEESVEMWNAKSEPGVSQSEFGSLADYIENHMRSAAAAFGELWTAIGVSFYDGGIFGMEQTDAPLDGGLFEDEELTSLDCGGFEPYVIPYGGIGEVVDGGVY